MAFGGRDGSYAFAYTTTFEHVCGDSSQFKTRDDGISSHGRESVVVCHRSSCIGMSCDEELLVRHCLEVCGNLVQKVCRLFGDLIAVKCKCDGGEEFV